MENAYLQGKLDRMFRCTASVALLAGLVNLNPILDVMIRGPRHTGWAVFCYKWQRPYVSAAYACICLTVAVMVRLQPVQRHLGYRTCEAFLLFMLITQALLEWEPPEDVNQKEHFDHFREAQTALALDALITVAHIMLPIRWCPMLLLDGAVLLLFVLFGIVQGATHFYIMFLFCVLLLAASVGLRSLEMMDRIHFLTIASERHLRAQAEFQRDLNLLPQASEARSQHGATSSRPVTTATGAIFERCLAEVGKSADTGAGFVQLLELGRQEQWVLEEEEVTIDREQVLGRGSFGLVVEGCFCRSAVAIKLFPAKARGWPADRTFFNELRILRHVSHPNIVQFHGALLEPNEVKLVLEKVEGENLQTCVYMAHEKLPATLPLPVALEVVVQGVLHALIYLHSRRTRIVHADLKPSNVMVEGWGQARPRAKLLDFGISRVSTRNGLVRGGTWAYMAPEVASSGGCEPSPAIDVFSLGVLLFHVASGGRQMCPAPPSTIAPPETIGWRRFGRGSAVSTLPWLPRKEPLERWRIAIEECLSGEPSARPAVEGVCDTLFGACSVSGSRTRTPGAVPGSNRIMSSMDSSSRARLENSVRL